MNAPLRPSDCIGELCIALAHRWEPERLFVIFTAYFDEADTHGPAPTVILAAHVGHAYQWRQFEKKLARLQQRDGFSIFHAKDFKARSGEFRGWSDEKCSALIADLTELIRNELTGGLTVALEHGRYINEYRAPPIPKKMNLDSQLVLLRHKFLRRDDFAITELQHGHRGRLLTSAPINRRRMVAIEFGM